MLDVEAFVKVDYLVVSNFVANAFRWLDLWEKPEICKLKAFIGKSDISKTCQRF